MKTWPPILFACLALTALCVPQKGLAQTTELDSLQQAADNSKDTTRIDALIALGRKLRRTDLKRALEIQLMASREAEAGNYLSRQAKLHNDMGISYGMQEDYPQAMEQLKLSMRLHAGQNNPMGIADAYNNLGIVYKYIGDYPSGLNAHLEALKIYDQIGEESGRAVCLLNIGVAYDLMKEPQKALEIFEQALKLKIALKDEPGRALVRWPLRDRAARPVP
ncbi:MAG: tetratricopeptide repeat protein [Saprospiraceae bacterium]|nr:tetratricopeptide repeat protein [Saprospiraceae bacterium]